MRRPRFAALLPTMLWLGCQDDGDLTSTGVPTYCSIAWSGPLATDASVFVIRACWNGRCASDIAIQTSESDAGTRVVDVDAGCMPAPTTPGGLPSGCRAARALAPAPVMPSQRCGSGAIGDQFSVHACATIGDDGETTFDVDLAPSRPSYPPFGGEAELTITTATGVALLAAEATVPSAESSGAPCLGGRFTLDGTPLAQ